MGAGRRARRRPQRLARDSYINLKPKGEGVVATARSSTLVIAIVAAALAVVIVVVLVLARRRRGLAEEE